MPSRSIIRTGVGRIGSQGIASRPWRRRSISSPRERLAFSRDETSVDPSARSSITPTQLLDSIVRGRALTLGHLLAMLVVLLPFALLVALVQWQQKIQVGASLLIIGFGVFRFINRRHPR